MTCLQARRNKDRQVFDFVSVWINITKLAPTIHANDFPWFHKKAGLFTNLAADCLLRSLTRFNGSRR